MDATLAVIVVLAVSVLGNAAAAAYYFQRRLGPHLVEGEDEAFIVKDRTGRYSPLQPKLRLRPDDPNILKFERRGGLAYPIFNSATGQLSRGLLVDDTGAISLRVQTATPPPFEVITTDNHRVRVTGSVSFAVERERILALTRLDNFGAQLERRIQSALSAEIGRRRDEELRKNISEIEQAVTAELIRMEAGDGTAGVVLGIRVFETRFQFEDADRPVRPQLTLVAPAPDGASSGAAPVDAEGVVQVVPVAQPFAMRRETAGPASLPGAMEFAGTELDKLLDQLKERAPEQIDALMRMMEMQTRQNIVAMLAQSSGLIVFSAKELGLDGNPVVEDRIASAQTRQFGTPKAAE